MSDAKRVKAESPAIFEQVKSGENTIVAATRELKEQKREDRREENRKLVLEAPPVQAIATGAKFATIVIDPPWD